MATLNDETTVAAPDTPGDACVIDDDYNERKNYRRHGQNEN